MTTTPKRAVLYLRLSKARDNSVSIRRQRKAGTRYAADKGWTIVGEFVDDGVSASKNAPDQRVGWREMTARSDDWDVVIIMKLDRAVRQIIHFWDTYKWLDQRGKALVSVEDNLDMTTTIGTMVAGLLAGFAQMEAEAISARVTGARDYLLTHGRYPGGRLPYGWTKAVNPGGKGYVIVQDPQRIETVRALVERTQRGSSVHSTTRWLTEQGVPTYTGGEKWAYNTVYHLLHHPLLAGLIPYNPGRASTGSKGRGEGVVLGVNGLPQVHERLAVMPVGAWRAMTAQLDDPTVDPRRVPRAQRKGTNALLSGLVFCGDERHLGEPVRMWRGSRQSVKSTSYCCPKCLQTLSSIEDIVTQQFLERLGGVLHLDLVAEVVEGAAAEYAEATVRLQELSAGLALAGPGAEFEALVAELGRVKTLQARAAEQPSQTRLVPINGDDTRTFAEDWAAAEDDERRRTILGHALNRIVVSRGKKGQWSDEAKLARMTFDWKDAGQVETPDDATLAAWAEG